MKITNQLLLICAITLVFAGLGFTAEARYSCAGGDCGYVTCDTNSDCGNNQFTGAQYCNGNSVYQSYITFICNNPGTTNSSCTHTSAPRGQHTCFSNESCSGGACVQNEGGSYTGYTPTYTTATYVAQSYRRCLGNTSYWYDSNGNPQNIYQICNNNQTCSNGECMGTNIIVSNYVFHATRGCVNNNSYWYDSNGSQQGIYQNCSITGQMCQSGQCIGTPTTSVQKPTVTTQITKTETQTQNNLTASVSANGSLLSFVKKWYIWLIIIIILIVLFIIVFRRLSSGS